ncbi:Callose synthase 9, variant 3 [Lathyrus oleraceus]|uniref:Callose synthase 9, variant 3 n=1 Tax=Pisum sativum TaxID=3888 RepID=A0A9D4WFY1_PEA|nr:Callose synthase 9, variant 3 [Pisum sativum]
MSRVEELWEQLVHAALRRERTDDEIAENVTSKSIEIDEILRVADEVQDGDPTVSRILCEDAYSLSHQLDSNSDGVLQFKPVIMSVMKKNKKEEKRRIWCEYIKQKCLWMHLRTTH